MEYHLISYIEILHSVEEVVVGGREGNSMSAYESSYKRKNA